MTDNRALLAKLAKLASRDEVFVSGGRVISRRGAPVPIVAVLREIDDTVLQRTLTFSAGGSCVAAVVGGRRLQGLTSVSADIEGASVATGKVLDAENDQLLQDVARIFTDLGRRDPVLTVRSADPSRLGERAEAGLSAQALASHWNIDLSAEPPTPIEGFLTNCGAAVFGSLRIANDGAVISAGAQDIVAELTRIGDSQVPEYREAHARLYPAEKNPVLTCLDSVLGDLGSCGVVVTDKETILFAYHPEQLSEILAAWRILAG